MAKPPFQIVNLSQPTLIWREKRSPLWREWMDICETGLKFYSILEAVLFPGEREHFAFGHHR